MKKLILICLMSSTILSAEAENKDLCFAWDSNNSCPTSTPVNDNTLAENTIRARL